MPSITINFTNAEAARIADAFSNSFSVPPTAAGYKTAVINWTKIVVKTYEKRLAVDAAVAAIPDPSDITPN